MIIVKPELHGKSVEELNKLHDLFTQWGRNHHPEAVAHLVLELSKSAHVLRDATECIPPNDPRYNPKWKVK